MLLHCRLAKEANDRYEMSITAIGPIGLSVPRRTVDNNKYLPGIKPATASVEAKAILALC